MCRRAASWRGAPRHCALVCPRVSCASAWWLPVLWLKSRTAFTAQVASIPIAIEIVCTTTLALGSRQLSAYGAIVTRLQSIEEMAGMNMLCSDKTGACWRTVVRACAVARLVHAPCGCVAA